METSSELNDDSQKLRAGLQRFSRRGLVAVQCGQGAERKTGWLHGGHYPLGAAHCEMLVQCTSPCCAGRPLALHPEGCLFNGSGFERHAGCERHKKWSESIRVLAPEECEAPAPAGDDAHIKPEQPAPDPPATPASAAAAAACAASTANVGTGQATGAGGSCSGGEAQGGDGAIADPARAAARALWPASAGITLRLFLCNVSRLLEAQHGLTGRPIWVFWLAENRWFKGKVESFRVKLGSNRSGRARVNWSHTVRYDDGDVEELHLGLELFSLQRPPGWQPDPQSPLAGQEQQAAAGAEGEAEQAAAEGGQAAEEEEEGGRGEDASAPDRRGRRCATAPGSVPAPCGNKRRRESPPVGSPVAGQERRDAAEGQQEQRRILQEGSSATPSQQADGDAQQPASREGQPQPMEQDGRQEQQPEQCQDEQWAQTQEQPGATPAQPGGQPAAVEQPGPAQLPALAPATANLEHLTRTLLARQPGTADAGLSPVLVWQFLLAWRRMAQSERQDYASMAVEAARHGSPEALTELLRSGLAAA